MSNDTFLTLHALHALPASLLNRDDTGATKTIAYGGTTRVRVSSQSWKRAARVHMRSTYTGEGTFGMRTSRLPSLVTAALVESGRDADVAAQRCATLLEGLGLKTNEKTGNTKTMAFVDADAPQRLAAVIDEHWDQISNDAPADALAAAKTAFDVGSTLDLALFGRMLADLPGARVEGSVNFAHAFSVDAAAIAPDFWTAVDDRSADGDAASSNLGDSDLSAPVLYRTAGLNRDQLVANLSGTGRGEQLADDAQRALIDAFLSSVPSGKQRSTAATTLPAFLVGVVSGRDTSMADAFATAVDSADVLGTATARLLTHLDRARAFIPGSRVVILPVTADPASLPHIDGVPVASDVDSFCRLVTRNH